MSAAAVYGFFLGISWVLFFRVAPQPLGSIVWWGFFTGQLIWGAALCWRRTRLPFATAALAIAAATSGLLTILAPATCFLIFHARGGCQGAPACSRARCCI